MIGNLKMKRLVINMENKMEKDKLGTRDTMGICVQALIEKGEGDELYDVLFKILKKK